MTAFQALAGAVLDGVWVDVPEHRVIVTLRADTESDQVTHTLVLEGVTDFRFFDENADAWPYAEVTDIAAEHGTGTMRLEFSFGPEAAGTAGTAVTCTKAVVHRAPRTS